MDMRTVAAIQLGLTGLLVNLHGFDLCKFGPNCDYPCHCQNNTVCDPLDGSCPTGCDDGDLGEPGDDWHTGAWSGYWCQLGNVAYDKIATQGVHTLENFRAGLAIDGNHDSEIRHGSCSHTDDDSLGELEPGWWQVDLGANFVIYGVKITNRVDCCSDRLQYTELTVSETEDGDGTRELCYRIGAEGNANTLSIECSQPLRGHYVRLQRRSGVDIHVINICEVQVFGYLFHDCPDAYYGVACGTTCNCQLPCHDVSGECPAQTCAEGWMGIACQTECNPGTWGSNCQWSCNCLEDQEVCDRFTGRCNLGCQSGFVGIGCNLVLPMINSSTVKLSNPTSSSVKIRFNAWLPGDQNEIIPSGYIVQRRDSGNVAWLNGTEIDHDLDTASVHVVLRGLEPDTEYYVRVIPYVVDGMVAILGHPTEEIGPFWTLEKESPVAMIAGVTIGLIVLLVLIVVIVFMARRRLVSGKDSSQIPMELDSTKPSLYEDVGPGGQENSVYLEIIEYPKRNDEAIYYNNPSSAENIQLDEVVKDIHEDADIILHDSSSTSFTSGDQESRYQKLGKPIQAYEVLVFAEELNKHCTDFKGDQLEQYTCMCKTFLEALQAEETSVPSSDIEIRYPELRQPTSNAGLIKIHGQYMLLQCSKTSQKTISKDVVLNHPKNHDSNSVPTSKYSAHLTTANEGRNDYMVAVDGYCNHKGYIATHLPMPNSVVDFWRLVYAHKSSCIIALQQPDPEDENTPVYWPTRIENPFVFGPLRVTLVQEESQDEGALSKMDFEVTISNKETHNVRLYQCLFWPADAKTSLSTEKTLMLLDHVERWQLHSGQGPLWFLCKFGYERCGLMVAACYMLEKLKVDREVDVFHAVQHVRMAQPEFVTSLVQYEFLYELAITYINSCEEYANFK